MIDIVERLHKEFCRMHGRLETLDILKEAADEIERLQRNLDICRDGLHLCEVGYASLSADLLAVQRECIKLREALRGVLSELEEAPCQQDTDPFIVAAQRVARAALQKGVGE